MQRARTALRYWLQGDPKAGPLAANVANDYVRYCRQHARAERRDLLPAALLALSREQWAKSYQALEPVADPLSQSKSREDCATALHQFAARSVT